MVHAYSLDIFVIAAPLVQNDLQKDSHATYGIVCWPLSSYHNIGLKLMLASSSKFMIDRIPYLFVYSPIGRVSAITGCYFMKFNSPCFLRFSTSFYHPY